MPKHITSLTALAKKNWFKTVLETLIQQGYTKGRIAELLGISPQRLTNISNETFAISDKMMDTITATFNLGSILITTSDFQQGSVRANQEGNKPERIIDRLDLYMLLCGITETQVTVNARLDHDALTKTRNNEIELNETQIKRILTTLPDLNETWLRTGEGNMKNGDSIPMIERKGPLARILTLLKEEGITLEEFAKSVNSTATLFNNPVKWPYDSRSLILGNDKAIRGWINAFCEVFPKYSKFWILTGKTSKYNYPSIREEEELI